MAKQIPCGLFAPGTDTGVGKTQVAALAHLLADRNLVVRPRKPVESGCRRRKKGNRLAPEDAGTLQAAARTDQSLAHICPYPLEPTLSPEPAAALSRLWI